MKVFVDASFLIALYSLTDPNHKTALLLAEKSESGELFTSEVVYFECITVISQKFGLENAQNFSSIYNNFSFNVCSYTLKTVKSAEKLLFGQKSKNLPFFDCLYASLMAEYNISTILTFDKHFNKLGVTVLS